MLYKPKRFIEFPIGFEPMITVLQTGDLTNLSKGT